MTKHKHHIVPRHMGGSDDPSNIIELSIEDHAKAHEELYVKHGLWQDMIAWKALSGQITMTEASRLAKIEGCKLGGRITYQKHGLPHEHMSEEGAKRHKEGRRLGSLAQSKEAKSRGGKNNTFETHSNAGKLGGKIAFEMKLGAHAPEHLGKGGRIGGKIGGKIAIKHLLSLRHLCHDCGKVTNPRWMNHHKAKTGHIFTVQI